MSESTVNREFESFNRIQKQLYSVLGEIRRCQNLCIQSQNSTFIGSYVEFASAHRILERVQRDKPVERQKELIQEMHRLKDCLSKDELNAVLDLSEKDHPLYA